MQIEGQLNIELSTRAGQVHEVKIVSSRPVYAARVFIGKPVSDVRQALPLLFSVCGTAQACAGIRAIEQASGMQASRAIDGVRNQLVDLETIREHCLRILLDWPVFTGHSPDSRSLRETLSLNKAFNTALTGQGSPFLGSTQRQPFWNEPIKPLLRQLSDQLEGAIYGISPKAWLKIENLDLLRDWAINTDKPAAAMINMIFLKCWENIGQTQVVPLPALPRESVLKTLEIGNFEAKPTLEGLCHETGCLVRTQSPLLDQSIAKHGAGLLSRLIARLTELAQLAARTQKNLDQILGYPLESEHFKPHNPGIGQVAAARGQLLHKVTLEQDLVQDYRIVAPTEWNFHPRGVVQQSLLNLSGDLKEVEKQARLLINAVDPCVTYDLSVN